MSPPSALSRRSKIPPPAVTIISSLADPLTSPYCVLIVTSAIASLFASLANALNQRDPILLDLTISWIKFFTHPLDDPIEYHDVEARLTTPTAEYQCQCFRLLSDKGLQEIHLRSTLEVLPWLRTEETCGIGSLVEVSDFLSDYLERLIRSTTKVQSLKFELQNRIDQQVADALGKGMAYWLRRNENVHVYALVGTLLRLGCDTMVNTMQSSASLRRVFWDRSYALIDSLYERRHQLPDSSSPDSWYAIDHIFYGMGCFAFALVSRGEMLASLYSENTQRKYDAVCRLLTMLNKANIQIQRADRSQDKYRLATFAQTLHSKLSSTDRLPLSPVVKSIMDTMPSPPEGFDLFFSYFQIIDRCHNRLGHALRQPEELEADQPILFSVTFSTTRRAVRPERRLQSCAGCNAVCYCSKECQIQDWKCGMPSHKELCSALAKMFRVHKWAKRHLNSLHELTDIYRRNGIPDFEVEKLNQHVTKMLYYFSELDGASDDFLQQ